MGISNGLSADASGLTTALFGKARRRVLGLLFANPGQDFSVNDVLRAAGMGSGAIQRELQRLSAAGLVTVASQGNQRRYQANPATPIYAELRGIAVKTFGLADVIVAALQPVADCIACAFIYGSVAKGTDTAASDIDVLFIAQSLDYTELLGPLADIEQQLGRPVHPTILKPNELRRKLREDSAFVVRALDGPKIFLIGTQDELEQTCQPGSSRRTDRRGTR